MVTAILIVLILISSPYGDSVAEDEGEAKILEALKESGGEVERDKKTGNARRIEFENRTITNETLELISQIKSLEVVYFDNCKLSDSDLTLLWNMPNFRKLYLYGPIKAEHLNGIEKAKSLRHFGGGNSRVDVSVIKALARCEWIGTLEFTDAELTDEAIKVFAEMPKLRAFAITGKHEITDASVAHLNNMNKLNEVPPPDFKYRSYFEFAIDPCKFTDKGLQHLKHHEKYTAFLIPGAPITDASLPVFKKLINCDRIDVTRTKLTRGAVKELSEILYLSDVYSDYETEN